MRVDRAAIRDSQKLPAIVLKKRPKGKGTLLYRPYKQHKLAIGGNVPALLAQSDGSWNDAPSSNERFNGQRIDRGLAKKLVKGELLGWGPVPSGETSGKGKAALYRNGWIWITEQRKGSVRTLYITDRKRSSKAGTRRGFSIVTQYNVVSSTNWRSDGGVETVVSIRIRSNASLLREYAGISELNQSRKGDKTRSDSIPNLDSAFAYAGVWEIWDTYWPATYSSTGSSAPTRFSGTRVLDAKGKIIAEDERFIPQGIPSTGSGTQGSNSQSPGFGTSVENQINYWVAAPLTPVAIGSGVIAGLAGFTAATMGVVAAALFFFGGPPGAEAAAIIGSLASLPAFVAAFFGLIAALAVALQWAINNLIAPGVGWAAQEIYDYFNPPPSAPPNPSGPPSTNPNILDSMPEWQESGAGMSELWEMMNDNFGDDGGFILDWPGLFIDRGSPPPIDPNPDEYPDPVPTPTPPPPPPPTAITSLPPGTPILVTVMP